MCASVDQHNLHQQDTLKLEKLETKERRKRVNMTIFGICVVYTWLAWNQETDIVSTQSYF